MADTHHKGWICHAFIMFSWKVLSHSDLPTDLKRSRWCYAIETAKCIDCRAVVDGYSAKGVAGLNGVPSHRFSFSVLLLVLLLILHLILEVLLVIAINAEVLLLKDKKSVTEFTLLEVDEPLRVKCISLVSGLKMEVRSC